MTNECNDISNGYNARIFMCSKCGFGVNDIFLTDEKNYLEDFPKFCPNCGKKVVGHEPAKRVRSRHSEEWYRQHDLRSCKEKE